MTTYKMNISTAPIASTSSSSEFIPSNSRSEGTTNTSSNLHPFVTQKLVDTGKYYCPFLDRGFCRESGKCNFSHDCHNSIKIPTDFCHFYLANQCLYGQECKFIHGEPILNNDDDTLELENLANINLNDEVDYADESDSRNYDYQYHRDNQFEQANQDDQENAQYLDAEYIEAYSYDVQMHNPSRLASTSSSSKDYQHNAPPTTSTLTSDDSDKSHSVERIPSNIHDNRHFVGQRYYTAHPDKNDQPQPSSSSTKCDYQPLKLLIAGSSRSMSGSATTSKDNNNDSHIMNNNNLSTSKIIDTSTKSSSQEKVWQTGRLLASLKGGDGKAGDSHYLKDLPLCPYSIASGTCPYVDGSCTYLHGQICDLCCMPCLHPYDEAQRRKHRDDCLREHEREMELSFAVQRSKDKICGICLDTVVEKKPVTSSRFGILEKCNHIFCLDCIRKWRGTKEANNKTFRACPECRVNSDFVVPSKYWVEDQDDKDKLIHDYKAALR